MKSHEIVIYLFFVVVLISKSRCADPDTQEKVNAGITKTNSYDITGLGGRFGFMEKVVAKKDLMDNDYFPPKSVYSDATDKHIRSIPVEDMAALSLPKNDYRHFTLSKPDSDTFLKSMKTLFQAGKYFEAIDRNIVWYYERPEKSRRTRGPTDGGLKQGIRDALDVHVKNQLITSAQKADLIKRRQLDDKLPPALDTPFREAARKLILLDITKYPGVKTTK